MFRLSTHEQAFALTEKLVNVILKQCPVLKVLILPWNDFRTNISDEYIYKLLTERKLKLFVNFLSDDTPTIKRMKKYEAYQIPSKQRMFDGLHHQNDILYANKNSTLLQEFLYFDRDIFGELSCHDYF